LTVGPEEERDADGELVVEVKLVVIRHPVHIVGPTATPAFTEHRLVDAARRWSLWPGVAGPATS
jgi:hypothetical protein